MQPLAGEWAVRRSLLASLSVPTGYAVELAALVDTVATHGVDALAQVDLGTRAHRHQSLHDLGGMAVQIMAASLARAGVELDALDDGGALLRQFLPGLATSERLVPVTERPPAQDVA